MPSCQWTTRSVSMDGSTEDRVVVAPLAEELLVVLADGAGGVPGGARAADIATSWALRHADADPITIVKEADRAVQRDPFAGETTLVVTHVGAEIHGASAGDSEAWLVHGDVLTAGQHRRGRLGSGRCVPVAFHNRFTGRLLVATDGLFGYARPAAIRAAASLRRLDDAARALVELVRLPSGDFMDDVAFVLVDLDQH
ncbi:MAG: hypothetical protein KTR31_00610 [Myxococcales bacterium]|nr:hypothetical protein [Myxococcales bacterium]